MTRGTNKKMGMFFVRLRKKRMLEESALLSWSRSLFPRTWQTLPTYLPFYLLLIVVSYSGWQGATAITVISPFHASTQTGVPFSGETVADALEDALSTIDSDAETAAHEVDLIPSEIDSPHLGFFKHNTPFTRVQSPTTFGPEVKGLSYEGVISTARSVLGSQRSIYGDLIVDGNSMILTARSNDGGPWQSDAQPKTFEGLKLATRDLAEKIFATLDPTVAGTALMRDRKFSASIAAFRRAVSKDPKDMSAQLNLCQAYDEAKLYDAALRCYGTFNSAHPRSSYENVQTSIAHLYLAKGNYEVAKTTYEGILKDQYQFLRCSWWWRCSSRRALRGLAGTLAEMHQNNLAVKTYKEFIESKPKPDEGSLIVAYVNMGACLENLNRFGEAKQAFEQVLTIRPDEPLARTNVAIQISHLGDRDTAIAELREIVAENPHFAFAIDRLGSLLQEKGDLDGATSEYKTALHEEPDFPKAHKDLASVLVKGKHLDEALAEYDMANLLDPSLAISRYLKSADYIDLGSALLRSDADAAVEEERKAVALSPDYSSAHYHLGVALEKQKEKEQQTIAEYQRAIELKPDYAWPHVALGNLFERMGRVADAQAEWKKAMAINPAGERSNWFAIAAAHSNTARLLALEKRPEDAIVEGRRAVQQWDDEAAFHVILASALDDVKRYGDAVEEYKAALQLNPDNATTHNNYAVTLENQKDFTDAIAEYGVAVKHDPANTMFRRNLARTYVRYGFELRDERKTEGAIAQYKKAIEVMPEFPEAHNSLAWQLVTSDKFKDPVEGLKQAKVAVILSQERDANSLDTLAVAYALNGDLKGAVAAEETAVELAPRNESFGQSLAKYRSAAAEMKARPKTPKVEVSSR
jgi:tetratricopeptide (TPR) repeat protein